MQTSSPAPRLARLALIIALMLPGIALAAASRVDAVSASSSVVNFPTPADQPSLFNAYTDTQQGTKDDEGVCHYRLKYSSSDRRTPIYGRVTSINPSTCVYTVLVGETNDPPIGMPAGATVQSSTEKGTKVNCANAASCSGSEVGGGLRALPAPGGKPHAVRHQDETVESMTYIAGWEDPAEINVTQVRVAVRAYYSGGIVDYDECMTHSGYFGDGWYIDGGYDYDSCEQGDTWGERYSERLFVNYAFCPYNEPTYAGEFGVTAEIDWYQGGSGWVDNDYVDGGCSSLLSPWFESYPGDYY